MKVFVVVIGCAFAIGGLVGGQMLDEAFSILGAVAGGGGLAVVLLSIGASIFAQEERRKKKQTLSPEMRAVFDRMLGSSLIAGASSDAILRWKPRPFHRNESKEDVADWFAHVAPWSHVDPRLIQVLIDRLYGNPMFELFVHASQNCDVIHEYLPLSHLFDKNLGDVAACPQVAGILVTVGVRHAASFADLVRSGAVDRQDCARHYQNAIDACEAAIHVEPGSLLGYLQLAQLKQLAGKTEEAINFCNQGLVQVEKMKKYPLPRRREMNLMGAVEDAERQLRSVLGILNPERNVS